MKREIREITSREEWLEWRTRDFTCSNLDTLFALNRFSTLEQLVAERSGATPRRERTPSQRAGLLAEHMFPAAVAEERPDWVLTKATTYHRVPGLRFGCTPDFWISAEHDPNGPNGLFQAKTVNERTWDFWQGRPPLGYTLQTLGELIVTQRQWGVLGIIVRNSELPLHLFEVLRHPRAEEKILEAVAAFWRAHDRGEFPTPTPPAEIAALLDDGSHVDLSGDNYLPEALRRRETFLAERGACQEEIEKIDEYIKLKLGAAATGWLPGWQLSWRAQHRKEYTVRAQDIRVLRVKRTKETDNADPDA